MSIAKVYNLDITKGRCKDTDEWEIISIDRTHKGYSPLGTLVEVDEPTETSIVDDTYNNIEEGVEGANGLLYAENNKVYFTKDDRVVEVITPDNFNFNSFKNSIFKINNYNDGVEYSTYYFVNNGNNVDIYYFYDDGIFSSTYSCSDCLALILYKCKMDNNIKPNTDIKIFGSGISHGSGGYSNHKLLYELYLFFQSNNTLFTINQCICYPSIKECNFTNGYINNIVSNGDNLGYLYDSTNSKWYSFNVPMIDNDWEEPLSGYPDKSDFTIVPNDNNSIIVGNEYNMGNYSISGFTFDDEIPYSLKCFDCEVVNKIKILDYQNLSHEYYITNNNNYENCYVDGIEKTSHFLDSDFTRVEIPFNNNKIPNGLFYNFEDNNCVYDIVCNSTDTITFGEYSFYFGAKVRKCYANNIIVENNAFEEHIRNASPGNYTPISYAPFGADYSEVYKDHPYWIEPEYSLIPTNEWTNELSFEFSGDTSTIAINGEYRTFTESPVVINECIRSYSIRTYNSDEASYTTSNITKVTKLPVKEGIGLDNMPKSLVEFDTTSMSKFAISKGNSTFSGCTNLTSIDLNGFKFTDVNAFTYLFHSCSSLESVDLSNCEIVNDKVNTAGMFKNCTNLKTINFDNTNFVTDDGGGVTYEYMFSGCTSLETISMYGCNVETYNNIKTALDNSNLSQDVTILIDDDIFGRLNIEYINESPIIYINRTYYTATTSPYIVTMNEPLTYIGFTGGNSNVTKINEIPDTSNVTDMSNLFSSCSGLTELDVTKTMNTSNVTNMSRMFSSCSGLTELDLSSFNTSNVTDMSYMFSYCSNLRTLDVSSFNIDKASNISGMFRNCTSLTTLKIKADTEYWWTNRLTDEYIQNNVTIIPV